MKQMAKVVVHEGELMAKITRSEACAKCGACHYGREEARLYPLPSGAYHEGEDVEIHVPDTGALPAAAIGYGVPLALMLLGLVVASALGLGEVWQIAVALASLGAGYLLLRRLEPILRKSGRFRWRTLPCQVETPQKK